MARNVNMATWKLRKKTCLQSMFAKSSGWVQGSTALVHADTHMLLVRLQFDQAAALSQTAAFPFFQSPNLKVPFASGSWRHVI